MKNINNKFIFSLVCLIIVTSFIAGDLYFFMKDPSSVFAYTQINFATAGARPRAITTDVDGNIYVVNGDGNSVSKITPAGVSVVLGSTGNGPRGIAIDDGGNIYTANTFDNNVSKIAPDGTSTILGSTSDTPVAITIDSDGNVYTVNVNAMPANVTKITPGGISTILATGVGSPSAVTVDNSGNLYVADQGGNVVYQITPVGIITTLGATGDSPRAIVLDTSGNIYTANYSSNDVTKLTPDGFGGYIPTVLGVVNFAPSGIAVDEDNNIYTTSLDSDRVYKITPDGTATLLATLSVGALGRGPGAITLDENGNIYTANYYGNNVSKIGNPTITEVSPVPSPVSSNALNYTFNTNSAGTISYGGSCTSPAIAATAGNNTITFDPLPMGTYSDCTITVTDTFGISNELAIPSFTVLSGLASITTLAALPGELTTATLNGEITSIGDDDVTERGFEYGLNAGYGFTVSETSGPYGIGVFSSDIFSLTCGATYHYRAYAINTTGTSYGDDVTFVTTGKCPRGPVGSTGPISPPPTPKPREESPLPSSDDLILKPATPITSKEEVPPKIEPKKEETSSAETASGVALNISSEETAQSSASVVNPSSTESTFTFDDSTNITKEVRKITSNLMNEPVVKTIGNAAVAVPVTTSILTLLASLLSGMSFINFPIFLSGVIFQSIGLRRKPKPWGIVYDSYTKKPLPFVRVEVLNEQSRKLQSTVTDINGRYGFLVSTQLSNVQLRAYRAKYDFPSKGEPTIIEQKMYPNIYRGGTINILNGSTNFDLPMDPRDKTSPRSFYFGISSVKLNNALTKAADILFAIGAIFGLINCVVNPSVISFVILALIILTFFLRTSGFKLKPFGITKDAGTSKVLPFSFVAIHDQAGERKNFTVSDDSGRYFLLVQKGSYLLKAFTPSYVSPTRTKEMPISTRKGWISKEVKI